MASLFNFSIIVWFHVLFDTLSMSVAYQSLVVCCFFQRSIMADYRFQLGGVFNEKKASPFDCVTTVFYQSSIRNVWKINDVAIRFFDHDLIVSAVENFRLSLILFDYISHATFPLEIFQEKIPLDKLFLSILDLLYRT